MFNKITSSSSAETSELAKYLSPLDVWAIAFGCIVGWGAFVMPGTTFLPVAGPLGSVIALAIGAVIMIIIGKNYAYLMNRRPGTGGVYTYTKEAFGRDNAFLCSWFLSLSYVSIVFLNATALFVVGRTLFGSTFQVGLHYKVAGYEVYLGEVALSVLALVVIGILFVTKKPLTQYIHTTLAIVLLLGSVIIAALCIPHIDPKVIFSRNTIEGTHGLSGVMTIILLSPWAFVGFDIISLETAHFDFPMRKSVKLITLSIILGWLVYASMSLVSVSVLPEGYTTWQSYISDIGNLSGIENVPTFFAAYSILGRPGLIILAITALAAIFTGVIGAYRATTRVLSTMAEDHILSEKFSGTSFCILFIMVISIIVSFLGRNALEWFVELTTLGAIVGFGYTSAAAYKFAREEKNTAVMRTGLAGTVITAVFAVVQLIPKLTVLETMGAESFLLLALWCLLGFLFYWKTMKRSVLSEFNGAALSSTVLFALLLYSGLMWFILKVLDIAQLNETRPAIMRYGFTLMLLLALGLTVMQYIQLLLRRRHQTLEREKIHAEEGSVAKSRFLFNMSHDIRTPMNAIIGYTNLARKENTNEKIEDYLSKIEMSSGHLLDLINDVLEMSRIENGKLELENAAVDICGVVDDLETLFSSQMKEKKLDFEVDHSCVVHRFAVCDRKNLNRVLLNIVSNAYKFTPENGSVSLKLKETEYTDDGIASYEFRVKDSGIGMSREFVEKLFTAFERERTSTVSGIQGTGLGMSIAKSLVDLMGGTIEVSTVPNEGTEFILLFKFEIADGGEPLPADEADADTHSAADVSFSGKRVLLVEDNDINREIAALILNDLGLIVECAENGLIAVGKVGDSPAGYYDLILMDIQMPVMDGYEATRSIRALNDPSLSSIPIVAMTANAFREDEEAAKQAGMQGHIAKPLDVNVIKETLAKIMQK